jgi:hypothetical protein
VASKRRLRRRSCKSKTPYPTEGQAFGAVRSLRARFGGGSWMTYKCSFCKNFHVGRPNKRKLEALRATRKFQKYN